MKSLILFLLGEAGRNYCRTERVIDHPFRRHPNADKKNFITRAFRKRNREQINVEDDVNDPCIDANNNKLESSYFD